MNGDTNRLIVKWLAALLVMFVILYFVADGVIRRSLLQDYMDIRKAHFERCAENVDRVVPDTDEVSLNKALHLLSDISRISGAHIILSDMRESKMYDSLEPLNLHPPGRAALFISKKQPAPGLRLRTTIRNEPKHFSTDRAYNAPGKLHEYSLVYYAPLHDAGDKLIGQIALAETMGPADDLMTGHRQYFLLLLAVLYAAASVLAVFLVRRHVNRPAANMAAACDAVTSGDLSARTGFRPGELDTVSEKFNTMLYSLEKSLQELKDKNSELIKYSSELEGRNQELNRRQRMIEFDLRLAHKIQQELLPQVYPRIQGLHISAANFQVGEIGGDCFDFYKLKDSRLGAFIGDVSGKGISAALVMSMVTILFSQLKDQHTSPSEILGKVNDIMYRHFGSQHSIYLTCFFINVDVDDMEITFSCAGHNPPFLYRSDSDEIIPLEAEGFGLGMFSSVTFEEKRMPIKPGDKIILYTDGVVDCRNEKGTMFGHDRLIQKVRENPDANSFRLTHFLVEELEEFAGGMSRQDDLTILILEVDGRQNGKGDSAPSADS